MSKLRKVKLKSDASYATISAILKQENESIFAPVFFLSKKLNKLEKNFLSVKKETFAIIFIVEKLRNFIMGTRFTIENNHSSLTTTFTAGKNNTSIIIINK